MEEIPGSQTMEILRERLIGVLQSAVPKFRPAYPIKQSYRATPGQAMALYLDHTLLKQGAGRSEYAKLCREAREWGVMSVCVPSNRVILAVEQLAGSAVKVCTVVGFPWGYANTESKVTETKTAIAQGAREIDMVIAVGLLKDEDWVAAYRDIRAVVEAAGELPVKVILETSELSLEEKIVGAYLACYAGAAFLKTSTGFASGGANIDDLHILRAIAGDRVGVKASGGVRTAEFAQACIAAGADRLGASASAVILGKSKGGGAGY